MRTLKPLWMAAGILTILFIGVVSGFFITGAIAAGDKIAPEDMNYVSIYPDVLTGSGQLNISWNLTRWDSSNYPDITITIYTDRHVKPVARLKLIDPTSLNKTGTRQIAYSGLTTGIYYINLQAAIVDVYNNRTYCNEENWDAHYNPVTGGCDKIINLDIVPVIINTSATNAARRAAARVVAIPKIRAYYNCEGMSVDCSAWQRIASQGRSWNITWGVPI